MATQIWGKDEYHVITRNEPVAAPPGSLKLAEKYEHFHVIVGPCEKGKPKTLEQSDVEKVVKHDDYNQVEKEHFENLKEKLQKRLESKSATVGQRGSSS